MAPMRLRRTAPARRPGPPRVGVWRDQPWGRELLWAYGPGYAAKLLLVRPGAALSLQLHRRKSETMLCLEGRALLYAGARVRALGRGAAQEIEPGVPHRLVALTRTLVAEASTAHLEDVVRLLDDYGRSSCQGFVEPGRRCRNQARPPEYKAPMVRENRLATIAIMLAAGQRLRAADLADRFQVSERTVYRDMQRLAEQGFPLAAIPGPNGGYALFPTAPARHVTLELDEAVSLAIGAALASQVVCRDDGGAARRALTKIQTALPDTISCALPDLLDLFQGLPDNGRHRRPPTA